MYSQDHHMEGLVGIVGTCQEAEQCCDSLNGEYSSFLNKCTNYYFEEVEVKSVDDIICI